MWANSQVRTVVAKSDGNTVTVDWAVNWYNSGDGFDWKFKDSFLPVATRIEFDLKNTLHRRDDVSSSTGVSAIVISERKTSGSIDPETTLVSEKNFWAEFAERVPNTIVFSYGTRGTERKISFTAPNAVFDDASYSSRGPLLTSRIPFVCQYDSGDDELSIVFK
jgi:hypothetical protein